MCVNTLLNVPDLRNFPVPLEAAPNSLQRAVKDSYTSLSSSLSTTVREAHLVFLGLLTQS